MRMKTLLSLLLALAMAVGSLPVAALAEESPVEPCCTDEQCAHEHEEAERSEPEDLPPWSLDEDGTLRILGCVGPMYDPDDQPWRCVRELITAVRFEQEAPSEISDLGFWFDGCVNLTSAVIPLAVVQIAPLDFADCAALTHLTYGGVDVLADMTAGYGDSASSVSLFSAANCGITSCTCTGSCTYSYRNYRVAPENSDRHVATIYCAGCGRTDGITTRESHSFSGNTCSLCGYTKSCSHGSSYTSWSGCDWSRYCNSCGALLSAGTSHGAYVYGTWAYYDASRHRRYGSCADCGAGSYSYAGHTTGTRYVPDSATQHKAESYCATCNTTLSSAREAHADTDGDGACDDCGYVMSRFSVTVPAGLSLTVSEQGEVYAATGAAIVNNSTGSVAVTGVTVSAANGWTLAPYSQSMAAEKVDAKLIGFAINGAATSRSGASEALALQDAWGIASGAELPLTYDAVVSASSVPVSEQVLTVVFVLEWA